MKYPVGRNSSVSMLHDMAADDMARGHGMAWHAREFGVVNVCGVAYSIGGRRAALLQVLAGEAGGGARRRHVDAAVRGARCRSRRRHPALSRAGMFTDELRPGCFSLAENLAQNDTAGGNPKY